MATVVLKNVKKIYPFVSGESKKKKKKGNDEPEEKKVNLQITEQGVVAVQEFNLEIADKEFIVLVGPSGCGKSTTLRMVAGLEEISGGELYIDGQLMNDVADAYIRRMDDAVHGQFDHLKITLEDTCRYQEKAIKNVADALSSFGDAARAMREIRQQSQEILDRYEGVLNRLSQAQLRNADETERLSGVVEKQTEYIQTLSALNDEFARQADSIREVTENFLENTGSMTEQHNELLTETAQKMSDASQTLASTMTDAREKLKRDMDESINYFEGCMTEILKRIEWASNAVKESVEGLPEAVQVSTGRYLDEIDHLVGALRAANGQLDDAGNRR